MTKRELVERYMNHKGYKVVRGEMSENLEPLLPWLIMDLQNSVYREHIKDAPVKHETKRARSRWYDGYSRFMGKLFAPFSEEEQAEIVDYMDDLETYLRNDVVLLKLAVMDRMKGEELKHRQIIAESYCCVILALAARSVYNKVYQSVMPLTKWQREHSKTGQELHVEPCPELDAVIHNGMVFCSVYAYQNINSNVSRDDRVQKLTNQVCQKAVRWLYK